MTSLLRQFRGLAIALAVLAISAGAVFASAPSMTLTSSHNKDQAATAKGLTAEASESAEPSESPEASKSPEPSESPDSHVTAPSTPDASPSESPDHGKLVSTAAQMPTPSGFPNHGAFVSCVAHMDASATGFDWTTVTPQSCGITPSTSATTHGKSHAAHGKSGQQHGKRGSHGPSSGG